MPQNAPSIFVAFPEAILNIFDLINLSYYIKNKNMEAKNATRYPCKKCKVSFDKSSV
jgi:hypothetical protein